MLSADVVQVIVAGNSVSDKPAHSSKLAASKVLGAGGGRDGVNTCLLFLDYQVSFSELFR